jgi:hypothetical protein
MVAGDVCRVKWGHGAAHYHLVGERVIVQRLSGNTAVVIDRRGLEWWVPARSLTAIPDDHWDVKLVEGDQTVAFL